MRQSQDEGSFCRHRLVEELAPQGERGGASGEEGKSKKQMEEAQEKEKSRRDQTELVRAKYLVSFPNEML